QNDEYKPEYHLGMTPNGASCGDGKYCLNAQCVSKNELLSNAVECGECESGEILCTFWYFNFGVCTNLGCRCGGEKGGDLCIVLSQGSSPTRSSTAGQRALGAFFIFLVFAGIWLTIFGVATVYYRVKRKENLPKM
ncbi:hypothetical protein PMAYCL1PPCAC_05744, partial [Pristionchus mayeri]